MFLWWLLYTTTDTVTMGQIKKNLTHLSHSHFTQLPHSSFSRKWVQGCFFIIILFCFVVVCILPVRVFTCWLSCFWVFWFWGLVVFFQRQAMINAGLRKRFKQGTLFIFELGSCGVEIQNLETIKCYHWNFMPFPCSYYILADLEDQASLTVYLL